MAKFKKSLKKETKKKERKNGEDGGEKHFIFIHLFVYI